MTETLQLNKARITIQIHLAVKSAYCERPTLNLQIRKE